MNIRRIEPAATKTISQERHKELVNFFMALIAVTDIQLDFLNELEGQPVYRQRMKQTGEAFKKECEKFIEAYPMEVKAEEAEKQMFHVSEIFNQFFLAIRKFDHERELKLPLLALLKAYNSGEGIRVEDD